MLFLACIIVHSQISAWAVNYIEVRRNYSVLIDWFRNYNDYYYYYYSISPSIFADDFHGFGIILFWACSDSLLNVRTYVVMIVHTELGGIQDKLHQKIDTI